MKLAARIYIVTLASLLPLAAAEAWNSYELHQARRAELLDEAKRQAEVAAADVQRILEGIWGITTAVSKAPVVDRANIGECSAYLASVVSEVSNLSSIATTDAKGKVTCSSRYPNLSISIAERPYFQEAMKSSQPVTGEFITGKVSGKSLLPLATVIKGNDGQPQGVVVATLDLAWLSEHLKARGVTPGGSVTIADRNGTILARQPQPEKFVGTVIPAQYLHLLREAQPGSLEVTSQDGTRRLLGYVPLAGDPEGLSVSTGLSTEASFAMLSQSNWRQLGFWLATLAISLIAAALTSAPFIQRPIGVIAETLRRLQNNDLSARTGMKASEGELAFIGEELDHTAQKLQQRSETVKLLMQELQHRSKNQISLILAMARQLAKTSGSLEAFIPALGQRLTALSTSHDLLLQSDRRAIDMDALLESQLGVFSLGNSARIQRHGPVILLTSKAVRKIGMALHELLTNAQKYGALSGDKGQVHISWQVLDEEHRKYRLTWQESDGPRVAAPSRTGFGSLLLEKIVPVELNGEAYLMHRTEGFFWQLDFTMPPEEGEAIA